MPHLPSSQALEFILLLTLSTSMSLTMLGTSQKWNHTVLSLCNYSISLGIHVFRGHSCWSMCQNFHFKAEPYCMCRPHCVYAFSHPWFLELLPSLAIMNNATMNRGVSYLTESLLSILLGLYPEVEFLDQVTILCLIFLRNCHIIFHSSCTILHSQPIVLKGSNFSTFSPMLVIFWSFCLFCFYPS